MAGLKGYAVYNRDGVLVMRSESGCRYPTDIEKQLAYMGYTIRLDGKVVGDKRGRKN